MNDNNSANSQREMNTMRSSKRMLIHIKSDLVAVVESEINPEINFKCKYTKNY